MNIENKHYQPKAPVIRAILRMFPDGLSVNEICAKTGISSRSVYPMLKKMPDCYIDRWKTGRRQPPMAIWCAVEVPEDCPKPRKSKE